MGKRVADEVPMFLIEICRYSICTWGCMGITREQNLLHFIFGGRGFKEEVVSLCETFNFDATNLPNSYFEPLYPKVFRGTQEVDLESIVCPPHPTKVR